MPKAQKFKNTMRQAKMIVEADLSMLDQQQVRNVCELAESYVWAHSKKALIEDQFYVDVCSPYASGMASKDPWLIMNLFNVIAEAKNILGHLLEGEYK